MQQQALMTTYVIILSLESNSQPVILPFIFETK